MIGTTIESRPGRMLGTIVLAALALICLLVGAGEASPVWLAIAALPGLLAVATFFSRQPRFLMKITNTGLEFPTDGGRLRYDEISGVSAPPTAKQMFPITIWIRSGTLEIPARIYGDSRALLDYLSQAVPLAAVPPEDPLLHGFYEQEVARHGPERVRVYSQRPGRRSSGKKALLVGLALLLSGIVWIMVGGQRHLEGLLGWGILWCVSGGIAVLVALARRFGFASMHRIRKAAVVVSPSGLALSQGTLQGEMEWEELVEAALKKPFLLLVAQPAPGPVLTLRVPGANIAVFDLFNRPLKFIHRDILRHLEASRAKSAAPKESAG